MTTRFWVRAGCAVMFLGIAFGAFGAHALRDRLTDPMKAVYETAVKYQLIHGLALFAVAWLSERAPSSTLTAAGILFLVGIYLFSGSLYALALTNAKPWGAVTPFGGLAFLAGWIALALAV